MPLTLRTRSESEIGIPASVSVERYVSDGKGYGEVDDTTSPVISFQIVTYYSPYPEYRVETTLDVSAQNLTPLVADISSFPVIKRSSSWDPDVGGTQAVLLLDNGKCRRTVSLPMQGQSQDQVVNEVVAVKSTPVYDFTMGVLWPLMESGTASRLLYRDKNTKQPKEIGWGSSRNNIEINPSCWAAGFDFSGVPIWNSFLPPLAPGEVETDGTRAWLRSQGGSPQHGGALVTPQHGVECRHFQTEVGAQLEFLASDGSVHTRSIVATSSGLSQTAGEIDILGDVNLYVLDSPLPATVAWYPIVGSWLHQQAETPSGGTTANGNLWQSLSEWFAFGCLGVDQARGVSFGHAISPQPPTYNSLITGSWRGANVSVRQYTRLNWDWPGAGDDSFTFPRNPYQRYGISGDSGSPWFVPVGPATLALIGPIVGSVAAQALNVPLLNAVLAAVDAAAVAKGSLAAVTGYNVVEEPSPV